MRALCQRVAGASVDIGGETVARIDRGLLVFLGVFRDDTEAQAEKLAAKTLALRVFADASKPMNRSVMDVDGSVLIVSQFTLAADTSRGNRPSFGHAAEPEKARALYDRYVAAIRRRWSHVATGVFGADMRVSLVNDGPVTILLAM